jgi:hypothetical protein
MTTTLDPAVDAARQRWQRRHDHLRRVLVGAARDGVDVADLLAAACRAAEAELHAKPPRTKCPDPTGRHRWTSRDGVSDFCEWCGVDRHPTAAADEEMLLARRPGSWEADAVRSLVAGWDWL